MRVGLLCGSVRPELDGVADYAVRLAAAAAELGVEPVLLGASTGGGVHLCDGWGLRGVARAAHRLRELDLDVVHVQWAPSAFGFRGGVGLLPAMVDLPFVTTLHEYGWWAWPALPSPVWSAVERTGALDREGLALLPRSRAVLVTNDASAPRTGPPARTVPIGPNVPVTAPVVEREPGLLVFFGFVHPVKGVRYLVEALAALPEKRLVVAGGFTSLALPLDEAEAFREELEQVAVEHGVADRVTFTGHLPAAEISALLRRAEVVVLPLTAGVTTRNGALLAALAHGAPVLATLPDVPDPALVDGEHVLFVPACRDAAALVDGLRQLTPEVRARLAAGGAALAAERSWERIAQAHVDVWSSL